MFGPPVVLCRQEHVVCSKMWILSTWFLVHFTQTPAFLEIQEIGTRLPESFWMECENPDFVKLSGTL